jgi:transcription factor CRZ1
MPNQMGDWSQPQFQGHRRSPSAHSEVSSVSPSPNLVSSDNFDDPSGHSPLQRPSDGSLYQEVMGIGSFNTCAEGDKAESDIAGARGGPTPV